MTRADEGMKFILTQLWLKSKMCQILNFGSYS